VHSDVPRDTIRRDFGEFPNFLVEITAITQNFSEEEGMCIRFRFLAFSLGILAFLVPLSSAQDNAARISTIQTNLNNAKAAFDQLPDQVKAVAHTQRRLAHLSETVNRMASRLAKVTPGQPWSDDRNNEAPDENGLVRVNNPARDFRFSNFVGYTQNESAIARCGDSVVVAFDDTGSILETLANGTAGISFSGVAASNDGGESFRDLGAVPPGGNGTNVFNADILLGAPSVACSDPNNFYIVQNYFPANGNFGGAIGISRSHDGGWTWSDPATVVAAPSDQDAFAFGPAVAVDPTNLKRVFVAYVHDFLADPVCGIVSSVEVVASQDGGETFGAPVILDHTCFFDNFLVDIGPRLTISSKGKVYAAWESDFVLGTPLLAQAIEVASFTPGSAPTAPVMVGTIACTGFGPFCASPVTGGSEILAPGFGDTTDMQGGFLNIRGFDLAVDRSGGPSDGAVYVAWDTALGNALAPEFFDISFDHFGFYAFTDIFFSRSADGQNFSAPQQLNSDLQPLDSRGHDHFQPALAVDRTGKVAGCWYDRRNDPENFQFERFCAESTNGGATWAEFRVNGSLSTPSRGQDLVLHVGDMGLYDGLTTDFIGDQRGFIGSFQFMSSGMNPDVKAVQFR
jgi:hypothetical protein